MLLENLWEVSPGLLDRHYFRKHGQKATYGQNSPNRIPLQTSVILRDSRRKLEAIVSAEQRPRFLLLPCSDTIQAALILRKSILGVRANVESGVTVFRSFK